jgi:hypothetical protein
MDRVGLTADPLGQLPTVAHYRAAIRRLPDAQLLWEMERAERARIAALSDAELLGELHSLSQGE